MGVTESTASGMMNLSGLNLNVGKSLSLSSESFRLSLLS